ncbi:MAG: hypothetical protein EBT04_06315 [Betaproteobacteria bacterium]|nr:hypothetical protein [Betaproteobacteria bacterium]
MVARTSVLGRKSLRCPCTSAEQSLGEPLTLTAVGLDRESRSRKPLSNSWIACVGDQSRDCAASGRSQRRYPIREAPNISARSTVVGGDSKNDSGY